MTLLVRGVSLTGYGEVAAEFGLDARAMLRKFGMDPRILVERETRVPAEKVMDLLEQSAEATGCESFGLRMAATRKLADLGPISLLLAHQPTMREALLTRFRFQRMMHQALAGHVEDRGDGLVDVRLDMLKGGRGRPPRQSYEMAIGSLVRCFSGPVGPVLRTRSVHFTHDAPADPSFHHQIFGPTVQFNSAFNGVICGAADLDCPNPLADATLATYAESYVRTLPFANDTSLVIEVQKAIYALLSNQGATMSIVAQRLGLGERTMQRRLAAEGAEFSALLNDIRRDHALRYLANPRAPLAEVAGLLGYTEETSFARWFSREFGVTPSGWRLNGAPIAGAHPAAPPRA